MTDASNVLNQFPLKKSKALFIRNKTQLLLSDSSDEFITLIQVNLFTETDKNKKQ